MPRKTIYVPRKTIYVHDLKRFDQLGQLHELVEARDKLVELVSVLTSRYAFRACRTAAERALVVRTVSALWKNAAEVSRALEDLTGECCDACAEGECKAHSPIRRGAHDVDSWWIDASQAREGMVAIRDANGLTVGFMLPQDALEVATLDPEMKCDEHATGEEGCPRCQLLGRVGSDAS